MSSLESIGGFVDAALLQGSSFGFVLLVLAPTLIVFGIRCFFFLRGQNYWIVLAIRAVFGILPTIIGLVLLLVAIRWLYFSSGLAIGWQHIVYLLLGLVGGLLVATFVGRVVEPLTVGRIESLTLRSTNRESLTDIHHLKNYIPEFENVDLAKQIQKANDEDRIYLGLNPNGEAISVPRAKWKLSHVQVMGPPGTGKGVQAAVTLAQSLKFGDAIFVFDPKHDEWAPSVFHTACKDAGVPFHYVQLSEDIPQINPLLNATAEQVAELFYAGFQLSRRGVSSDFYRLDDREAARQTAKFVESGSLSMPELLTSSKSAINPELIRSAKGFFSALREVADLKCVHTHEGVDIESVLEQGGCIYIVGSMRNEPVVILQKMLIVRLIQVLEQKSFNRHCSIFLDEFKHLLSPQTLGALSTIRDKGCNILLAHQSLGDFSDCGSDLSEASVRATVLDTTPIKWLYRPTNNETAQWISDQTGHIRIDIEQRKTSTNPELVEIQNSERILSESQRNLIDVNMVMKMPDGCAVCIGTGTPTFAATSAIKVDKVHVQPKSASQIESTEVDLLSPITVEASEQEFKSIIEGIDDKYHAEPFNKLLIFIYDETWTHTDVLLELLAPLSTEEVNSLLSEMESKKLIRSSEVETSYGPDTTIWGISARGCATAIELTESDFGRPAYRKGTAHPLMLNHHLDLQRARIRAEGSGWKNWIIGDRGRLRGKMKKYPDAIATRSDGKVIAVELERTIKTPSKYSEALVTHLDGRRKGMWDEIYYVCQTPTDKERLSNIFSNIKTVQFQGESIVITPEHREPFKFFSYSDDWSSLGDSNSN